MKRQAGFYMLVALSAIFFLPRVAFADTDVNVSGNGDGSTSHVSVNSQSSGQSIHCVNGSCTTTGGGSKTTVCHNGVCSTTDNGNVDYQSEDGHTQVHVHNNTSGNSVSVSPDPTDSPDPSTTEVPKMTPDPTITQMRNEINKHVKEEVDGIKEHVKDQNAALSSFIQSEMNALQKLLNGMFK